MKRIILALFFVWSSVVVLPSSLQAQFVSFKYFPRVFSISEMGTTGLAVVNTGSSQATLNLVLRSANGVLLGTAVMPVPASGQASSLISQLFPAATSPGWIHATTTSPDLKAFWVGGDFSSFTDGAATATPASIAIFPLMTDQTEVTIVNLGITTDATTLLLRNENGVSLAQKVVNIPAGGAVQGKISELIPGASTGSASGVALFAVGQTLVSSLVGTSVTRGFLAAQESVVANGTMTIGRELRIPYVVQGNVGASYKTVIGVTNVGSSATVTLTLTSNGRAPISIQRTVASLGSLQGTITDLFGVADAVGWVRIVSNQNVTAWAAYADNSSGGVSIVPADAAASSPLVFGHIADLNPWSTGVALLNATNMAADVEIFAFDPAGAIIDGPATSANARFTLPAGTNRAFLLSEAVPRTQTRSNDGGYVVARTTNGVPITGLELFFLRTGKVFANVPSNVAAALTHPEVSRLSTALNVTRAFTTETVNNIEKTTFVAGETVRLTVDVANTLPFDVAAHGRFRIIRSGGVLISEGYLYEMSLSAGTSRNALDLPIPSTAPAGTYGFEATVTYNGVSSTMSSGAFTITPPSPIEVTRAYAVNSSGAEATVLVPGTVMALAFDTRSTLTTTVPAQARGRATGPNNYVLADTTSTIQTPPGATSWFLTVSISPIAPLGVYTFEATVTYNGVTSTKTSTFTLAGSALSTESDLGQEVIERVKRLSKEN